MNPAENPEPTPTPAPEQPKPEAQPAQPATPQAAKPAPAGPPPIGPKVPRERPEHRPGRPPALDAEQFPTSGPRLRDLDREIEDELAAAMAGFSDKEMIGEPANRPQRQQAAGPGGSKKGRIISIHGGDVFVEVPGGRSQGLLPSTQFPEGVPPIGTEVDVTIEGYDEANGLLKLSRRGAVQSVDWSSVAEGMVVEARVTGTNKGGLSVEVNGIRGFLPISQIDMYRVEQPEQFLNQRLRCLVTEVQPDERNLVVSRRALMERERETEREKFWSTLAEGQVREGVVRSIKPFGAFVDLGGADGMIPVSEIAWTRVNDPGDVLQLGQRVQVKVVRIDPATRKIGLSLRQLAQSPWDAAAEHYRPGLRVTGRVTRTAEFGAFVELEPGVEGLIHISELGTQRVRRVRDVVQEGQQVEVQVLSVDPDQRRISLSLKAAQAAGQSAEDAASIAEYQARKEQEESGEAAKPERKRNYTLRGGVGGGE